MIRQLPIGRVAALAAILGLAVTSTAWSQQTTGSIRGSVTAATGEPISAVEVRATNTGTGVTSSTVATNEGRYRFPSLPVGRYAVSTTRIGFQPATVGGITVTLGSTSVVDVTMQIAAAELEALEVTAAVPLIDPDQSGVVDLVSRDQVEAIPVDGRNFSDLIALSPKVGVGVGDGSGGNLSLSGGRRGANLIQIDGAGTTGTFFGGEARGSDRIPFAFSIESVDQFQVITNSYDVEYSFFSGGVINAVTKSGTNQFHGSVFTYWRDASLTQKDFFDRDPVDYKSWQIGGYLSGPIIRDKLHFFVSVERQDRDEPINGLPAPGSTPDPRTRVHPDSVGRFLDILENVYGVEDAAGQFKQTQDEWNIFARVDWQINDKHRLTLRHNYTDLEQLGDRISEDETFLNGGVFLNTSNSFVASLNSVFSGNLWNEFKFQYATEPRPREANTLLPESEVNVTSEFPDGTVTSLRGMECCNDAVLPNNLEETTLEIGDNLHMLMGKHELKLGAQYSLFDYVNFFFFNQQGQFDFNSLSDFENGIVDDFGRNLPNPGPDGEFFTDDDIEPLAEYKTYELSFYAQDAWRATDKLTVTGGLRLDMTRFPDKPPLNEDLANSVLAIRTDVTPDDTNLSPRLGFTYLPTGRPTSVVRGGVGLFFGRFPSVLYSNSLLNTGGNQLNLFCADELAPTPDYRAYQQDLRNIPTACVGGGEASPPVPNINTFEDGYQMPRTWKMNLGYEQEVKAGLRVGVDVMYATTSQNYYVEDRNLLGEQFRAGIEDRPVFAPADEISGGGTAGFGDQRIDRDFNQVLVHTAVADARTYQLSVQLGQRLGSFGWDLGYTYSNSRDNASYSCCISSTSLFETPTAGSPNFLGERGDELNGTWGPADFNREHTIVLSGIWDANKYLSISGFWRTFSGLPWTPVIDGDPNQDDVFSNDRAYIGDDLVFDDPAADLATLSGHLSNFECLAKQNGRIATRNSCRNDWFTTLDLRIVGRLPLRNAGRFELIVDFFNVLNLLNSDWSRNVGVPQFGDQRELLAVEGFDDATQTYTYSVNDSFGEEADLAAFRTDQGRLQLGVRYVF